MRIAPVMHAETCTLRPLKHHVPSRGVGIFKFSGNRTEIVLQGAVYYQSGDFADQQTVLVSMEVINGWFTQNGLTAIAV